MAKRPGAERLEGWLAKRAGRADHLVAVEEALVSGRFVTYAARRLSAFALARVWATVVHVVELVWLWEIFSVKPFVASLALQNVTLVVDASFWGALEAARRRARELGPGSEAAALVTRWLAVALRLGVVVLAAPIALAAWRWWRDDKAPSLLDAYAMACALRLALDLVLRTFYSGVFAHRRVHRPMWSTLVAPFFLLLVTWVLWERFAGWSFVAALFASIMASRALLFVFTERAYRRHRIPAPSFRVAMRRLRGGLGGAKGALLAALANVTTRLGSVVLLAAVVPSLVFYDADVGGGVEPFAFALHLAAPLVLLASQWAFVFYHDEKRLERDEARALARAFRIRTWALAVVVGAIAWALTAGIVLAYMPWSEVSSTLLALAPAMVGLSLFAAAQLRTLAQGEFVAQTASACAMLAVLATVVLGGFEGDPSERRETWFVVLGTAPFAALLAHAVALRVRARQTTGLVGTLAAWSRALRAVRGEVVVWEADARARAGVVAERIGSALDGRGAVVRIGRTLLWFERAADGGARRRADWLACASGTLGRLVDRRAPSGDEAARDLALHGPVREPSRASIDDLAAAHARMFPNGFVVRVGARPPKELRALSPIVRQAIWRDGLRAQRRVRARSGFSVTAYAPDGALRALFVAPRPTDPEKLAAFRALADEHAYIVRRESSRVEG